jgi:hypothetical protein
MLSLDAGQVRSFFGNGRAIPERAGGIRIVSSRILPGRLAVALPRRNAE